MDHEPMFLKMTQRVLILSFMFGNILFVHLINLKLIL